jgi:four helix bundle protein
MRGRCHFGENIRLNDVARIPRNSRFMPTKSIDIRERAFEFACDAVRFCDRIATQSRVIWRLVGQLLDSGTAIGANLEEAAGGQSKADFIAKTFIAYKEARETRFWLRLISVCYPKERAAIQALRCESEEIVAILTTILRRAQSNPRRS